MAKQVHFEEAAETASPPQVKKKRREVKTHDWAKQQADKKAADRKRR